MVITSGCGVIICLADLQPDHNAFKSMAIHYDPIKCSLGIYLTVATFNFLMLNLTGLF
jgi:hypothetical protein